MGIYGVSVLPGLLALLAPALSAIPAEAAEPPVLRVSLEAEPVTLDWQAAATPMDRFFVSFLMRGLLRYDSGHQSGLQPVCDLCQKFAVFQGGTEYRFDLKADEVWSDGEKLEASHFVEAFRRLQQGGNAFPQADQFASVEAVAEGKQVLVLRLKKPQASFPHLLTHPAVFPIRKIPKTGTSSESPAQGPVLGPYQLVEWVKGKRIVLEGNPSYLGSRPVYRVDFLLGGHADLLKRFKSGRLDIFWGPTTDDLLGIQDKRIQMSPYWATRALLFQARGPLAVDVPLRRAILHALDRGMLPGELKNGERPVAGLIPPGLPGSRALPFVTRDLSRAQQERAQVKAPEAVLELVARDTATDRTVARWLAESLLPLKIKLMPRFEKEAQYLARLRQGKFKVALTILAAESASSVHGLRSFTSGARLNWGGWTHVPFETLLSDADRTQDQKETARLSEEASRILEAQEAAVVGLGYPAQSFLLGHRVISFATTPFGAPDLVKVQLKR